MQRYGFASAPISNGGYMSISLYQNPAGFANRDISGVRHNAHAPDPAYAFCPTAFLQCLQMKPFCVPSVKTISKAYIPDRIPPEYAGPESTGMAWKFLCFAQIHPMYSGGSTGLTDFFGVTVSPSISQRNCCCVSRRTSSGLRGHWKRLSESLLYNRSHPSSSHTSPLMRSDRLPQKR